MGKIMNKPEDIKRRALMFGLAGIFTLFADRKGIASDTPAASIEQPERSDDASFIARAFGMQRQAIESGDQAYGAVVVRDGRIVAQSPSRVVIDRDPTAHAEMEAIREAARRLGSRDLSRCTLYSSSPACPMCEAAAYWAGIERMVYGKNGSDGGGPRLCG